MLGMKVFRIAGLILLGELAAVNLSRHRDCSEHDADVVDFRDYAGNELFLIEGDSLLLQCFTDSKLDFDG
jgi:hypothetical protein